MNSKARYHQRRLADVAQALRWPGLRPAASTGHAPSWPAISSSA